jgi:flagellar assembly protein FliH
MTRTHARFIPGEEVATVAEWDFGAVDKASIRFAAKLKAQADAEEQSKAAVLHEAGYAQGNAEGFAAGFAQGHAQATLEGQRQINEYIATQGKDAATAFANLFDSAGAQLAEAEQAMAKGVLELACELARQVLRHELSTNPNALQPVVREALGVLAVDSKAALVRMNPLDMEVLSEVLRQEFSTFALTLVPDASVARGGCLVESAGTVVDGTVEKRWMRAVASLGFESPWEPGNDATS